MIDLLVPGNNTHFTPREAFYTPVSSKTDYCGREREEGKYRAEGESMSFIYNSSLFCPEATSYNVTRASLPLYYLADPRDVGAEKRKTGREREEGKAN